MLNSDRKKLIAFSGIISLGFGFWLIIFVYKPLLIEVNALGKEVKKLEQKLEVGRKVFDAKDEMGVDGHLLTRKEISLAIDEITKVGKEYSIDFISISPRKVEVMEGERYPIFPIHMELQSEYKDLGLFLGALEKLEESIVTVRSFHAQKSDEMPSLVKSQLVVGMYLQEGESGEE